MIESRDQFGADTFVLRRFSDHLGLDGVGIELHPIVSVYRHDVSDSRRNLLPALLIW